MDEQIDRNLAYAQRLAQYLAGKHWPENKRFEVLRSMQGVLSQIDNMICGLERRK
jgi:hypothetical protein